MLCDSIYPLTLFGAVLLLIALSLGTIVGLVSYIASQMRGRKEAKDEAERMRQIAQLPGRISEMGRWCCWHFPIMEDVERYLLRTGTDGRMSISEFRDALIRKYGDRSLKEWSAERRGHGR